MGVETLGLGKRRMGRLDWTVGMGQTTKTARLNRYFERSTIQQTLPFLWPGDRVLEVGTDHGEFLEAFADHGEGSIGVDPHVSPCWTSTFALTRGDFPDAVEGLGRFDAIVMMSALHHTSSDQLAAWASTIAYLLEPGGRFIATVPSRFVSFALHGDIDTMADPQHALAAMTGAGLFLKAHRRFQFGLNNLYVFQRRKDPPGVLRSYRDRVLVH
jgi:2-polyprenyl-3-methyl-5-hydroxy-6-metoxy-1,4-benzoquinol methylase